MVLGDVVSLVVSTMYARRNQGALTRDSIVSVIEPNKDNSMSIGDRAQITRLTTSRNTMRLRYIRHSVRHTYMPSRTHNTSHPTSLLRGCVNPGIPITVKQPLNRSFLD